MAVPDIRASASLFLGAISILTWAVAEIPQMVVNYKHKSTTGLSIAFLATWIIGDMLNLVGCLLQPATLMTQLCMALLFTAISFVLTGQSLYYGYLYRSHSNDDQMQSSKPHLGEKIEKKDHINHLGGMRQSMQESDLNANSGTVQPFSATPPSSPVFSYCSPSTDRDLFYQSARFLSSSPNTAAMPYLSSSHGSGPLEKPLLSNHVLNRLTPSMGTKNLLCVVPSSIFFLCTLKFHLSHRDGFIAPDYVVMPVSRKLLQDTYRVSSLVHNERSNKIGTYLGWAMAVIYMGGRFPQICLNIKRGHVEGLSPLMFGLALLGNGTYIASILASSLDWSKIAPNLPWLVDACGCVLLDIVILIQFRYYKSKKRRDNFTVLK